MREGFYKVLHAPRWEGYSTLASVRELSMPKVVEKNVFDGLIGIYDSRMLELERKKLTEGRSIKFICSGCGPLGPIQSMRSLGREYSIPIIFSSHAVEGSITNFIQGRDYAISFFRESELSRISVNAAEDALGSRNIARYGIVKTLDIFSKKRYKLSDSEDIHSLEDIPRYLLATTEKDALKDAESESELENGLHRIRKISIRGYPRIN